MSLEEAATVEPTSVVYRAIKRSGLQPGENVFIVGAGPVGLLMAMVANHKCAKNIIFSEPLESRRQKALEMGATHVLNTETEDNISRVEEINGGVGADVSFDAVGLQASIDTAVYSTRKDGRIGLLGFAFYESPTYPLMLLAAFGASTTSSPPWLQRGDEGGRGPVGKGELTRRRGQQHPYPFDQIR